jgi:hypothetical protein
MALAHLLIKNEVAFPNSVFCYALPMQRCGYCGNGEFVRLRTGRAKYCAPLCRARMYRLQDLLTTFPPCIGQLMVLLQQYAPPEAHGYRLFWLRKDGSEVGFPRADGLPWVCSTGRRSYARCFRLFPFEAPMVPHAGTYGVGYIARKQTEIPPGEPLLGGVHVEPLRILGGP